MLEQGNANEEKNTEESITNENDFVPPQLIEVKELIGSANRKLEDCALEWQAKLSQQQWKSVSSKSVTHKPWEQSILARTYFTDKTLDVAFQGLLSCGKVFSEHLKKFIALLQDKQCDLSTQEKQSQTLTSKMSAEPVDHFSLSEGQNLEAIKRKKQSYEHLLGINNSFADVIKAKINFDTKFLGFEAILHRTSTASPNDNSCLCQLCSNVLGNTKRKNILKADNPDLKSKRRQHIRTKQKRLTRSTRTLTRKQDNSQWTSFDDAGDKSSITQAKSKKVVPPL